MYDDEQVARAGSPDDIAAADEAAESRSLIEDVEVLIEDGRTYLEAELNFQKTRALFVGDRAKGVALYGLVALIFVWMALVGLTVGAIFALAPVLGGWGATAVVVVLWLLVAGLALRACITRVRQLGSAFAPGKDQS